LENHEQPSRIGDENLDRENPRSPPLTEDGGKIIRFPARPTRRPDNPPPSPPAAA